MLEITNKKVLVAGLGVSGISAAKLLAEKGADVWITDSGSSEEVRDRAHSLRGKGFKVETGAHTDDFASGAELVVVSPGVDHNALLEKIPSCNDVKVIGELELGYRFCKAPVVAVTGTNGKSTTTELMGNIFSFAGVDTVVCGNIGNPLCGEVDSISASGITVAEVSSFQLDTIESFKAHVAVLLNVAEDHYDRHGGFEDYKVSKFNVFNNQTEDDWAIIHYSLMKDPLVDGIESRVLFYGREGTAVYLDAEGRIIVDLIGDKEVIMDSTDVQLRGAHNLENVMCSILAAKTQGLSTGDIIEGISSFKALRHRFQQLGTYDRIEFIDDSKATNIDATRRALESVDKKVVLIAGGVDKGGDYTSILPLVQDKVKVMIAMGQAREKISAAYNSVLPVIMAEDMADSVSKAVKEAAAEEAVILSPMCSSFDMYSSYKERGKDFQQKVREYFGE